MKTLTIGSATLELNNFIKKWDKIGGVYSQIEIPTTEISYEDLKALFTDNQYDLIVTEEDGSTSTYSGYSELQDIKESIVNGVYTVVQYCTSTAMHLLNEARKQIETLQTEKAELQERVNVQAAALENHANKIYTQGETITELKGTIENQNETIFAQTEEIGMLNDTLLEVLLG